MDLSPGLFRWRIERQAITVRSDSDVKSRALDGKVVMALADVMGHGLVPHCWWRFAALWESKLQLKQWAVQRHGTDLRGGLH
jgi:hypothetical protein